MNYCLAKLKFTTPIHSGFGDLVDTQNIFLADTIFSALCIEALNYGGEDKINELVHLAEKNDIKISDAFPFLEDDYYLPKPVMTIERSLSEEYASKKQFKKLKYISIGMWDTYFDVDVDVDAKCENDILKAVGKSSVKVSAAKKGLDETMPYAIGNYSFSPNAGLYFILGFQSDKERELLKELIVSLASTGIGGKKSSGYGKFMVDFLELPNELNELINLESDKYMSLTTCMV